MSALGLHESLTLSNSIFSGYDEAINSIVLPDHRLYIYSPGTWVLLTAFACHHHIPEGSIIFQNDGKESYAKAIGLHRAIWANDPYEFERKNEGKNYSPLVNLQNQESTDAATQQINNCIRHFFTDGEYGGFVSDLCDLVGDLHDNVWSHGMASGFSMAQKTKVPHSGNDYYLEFALADHGMGLLSELKRVGESADNDQEAIEWCIQEGHSTKMSKPEDDWAQTMPDDMIGNPLLGIERTKQSDNHHMGLGLFKLIEVVTRFSGELRLATGNKIFLLAEDGNMSYKDSIYPWQGVAISCRFNTALIENHSQEPVNSEIQSIMDLLRRSS